MKTRTRKTVGLAAVVIARAAAVALGRTARLRSVQVAPGTPAPIAVDAHAAAQRLASLVRVPTITWDDESQRDIGAFDRIVQVIEEDFPLVHRAMTRERVARWSLLYTWRGRRPELAPIILCAHLDVVPIERGTETTWTHPPFEGAIAEGSVWGRGTLDDKAAVAGVLEAAEALLRSGFAPERTVYFAFGHNEEGGGDASGAGEIARELEARGVRHAWLLDEGGLIYDQLAGARRPVALVGVAEKGFMNLEILAHAADGHSAMPPPEPAVLILARALDRIARHPLPARLDGAALEAFRALAPDLAFPFRMAIANLWLMRPLVLSRLSAQPPTNALVRTTIAPTMLSAGTKPNALPAAATAVVNVRMLPGDTADAVTTYLHAAIADQRIEIRRLGAPTEASSLSPSDTPQFAALARSIRAIYPNVLVAPYLTITGTDAHRYARIADTYRFLPIFQPDALASIHGTNEHIRIDVYERAIRTYATILRSLQ